LRSNEEEEDGEHQRTAQDNADGDEHSELRKTG
jgi:hypothetical protein